jgi:hypothetical protein
MSSSRKESTRKESSVTGTHNGQEDRENYDGKLPLDNLLNLQDGTNKSTKEELNLRLEQRFRIKDLETLKHAFEVRKIISNLF